MKKIIFFALLVLNLAAAFAENFYIDYYDIDVNVSKTNNLRVVEYLETFFTRSSHGIFRTIPLKGARLSNVSVSENFSKIFSTDSVKIKIGNPDKFVSGKHFYRIGYNYQLPKDPLKDKDEFYFNIVGTDWNTDINKVHFKITMPEPFDASKVGLSLGYGGTKGFKGSMQYKVDSKTNTIEGLTLRPLKPNEAITIRVELPEGYFMEGKNQGKTLAIFLILILGSMSYLCWYIYGRDEKVIPVVNFYPPKNLLSAEMGVAYSGSADYDNIVSMMLELANKGYILIKNYNNGFVLELLKPYDGNRQSEKMLMEALFLNYSKKVAAKDELAVSRTFYLECQKIIAWLNKFRSNIFEASSISFGAKIIPSVSIIGLVLSLLFVLGNYNFILNDEIIIFALFPIIAVFVMIFTFEKALKKGIFYVVLQAIWALFFGGGPLIGLIATLPSENITSNIGVILLNILALIVAVVCLYQMPKRNKAGTRLLGEILGFKKFLETAEKTRLQRLMKENPMYCFDILPFAYTLGVLKEWVKKIEGVVPSNPSWYEGDFSPHSFSSFTNSFSEVSRPSTLNGGVSESSSGGGGCSGGGHGGGGGGSW